MVYENVSKSGFKRSRHSGKRRFSQQSHNGKQTQSDLNILDMPEPLESWSLEDFNDLVHFERG